MERLATDYEWSVLLQSDTTPRCSVWWRINGTSRGRKRKTGEHGRNEKETAQRRAFNRISYGCCVLELNRSMRAGFQNFGGLVLGFIMFYGNCEAEFPKNVAAVLEPLLEWCRNYFFGETEKSLNRAG